MKLVFVFFSLFFMTGCLKTYYQIQKAAEGLSQAGDYTKTKQKIIELERRVSLLEKNTLTRAGAEALIQDLRKTITRLEDQNTAFLYQNKLKTQKKPQAQAPLFEQAEKHFENKNYKKAILTYEEFRKKEPSGEKFKIATMKIALSFMNLNLKDEARVFFKEIIQDFPGSEEAKQAQSFLK